MILLTYSLICFGQKQKVEIYQHFNYEDTVEINGLIYFKADTTLVTGKVVRYNKKNNPKKYMFVSNGKIDYLGWINVVENKYIESFDPIFKKTDNYTGENQLAPYDEFTRKDFNRINELNRINERELSYNNNSTENNKGAFSENKTLGKFSDAGSLKDGLWQEYYENGQLRNEGNYIGGKKVGLWKEYHDNGSLANMVNFKEGKKEGLLKNYYSDGQIKGKINYIEGKENGMMELYHQNGKLMLEGFFKNAVQISLWEYYDEDGKLINIETFDN